ncbi:hypothetical protein [Geomicrobium sp. JCM 19055]|uniref:hypothetical protein n=1 Tax=Geomicrobium sp. JCM 19055 TaxID=1460649 RepID=UPI00187CB8DB|nr:hypothetical protein [Geomicrobium sp. JCM 19055]
MSRIRHLLKQVGLDVAHGVGAVFYGMFIFTVVILIVIAILALVRYGINLL